MTIFSSANFPPHYRTILAINRVHAPNWFTELQPTQQIDSQNDNSVLTVRIYIYTHLLLLPAFFYKRAWLCILLIHFIFAFFLNYFPFQGPMNLKMFLRIIWLETIVNFKVQNVKYAVST